MSTRTLSPENLAALESQAIELPSWAFGNSGTRFRVFPTPGTPRDPFEKIADAAQVNVFTRLAPSVALHIPWDAVDDFGALRTCLLYTSPSPRDKRQSRMPSSA